METIALILQLIAVALMGTVNALFCYFLDYTFWKGAIFQGWLPFLARTVLKLKGETVSKVEELDKEAASEFFLYKVLGGCPVCTNIWIGFISWTVLYFATGLFEIYYGIVYLMVSSAILRKFVKATY